MGKEIERKFKVIDDSYKNYAAGVHYRQGYLCSTPERVVRVRLAGNEAFITVKGEIKGVTRPEYEYRIPYADAAEMLDYLCEKPIIEKYRYKIGYGGFTWEVDEFLGENEGLVIAEIELNDETQEFQRPAWLGDEVSDDIRYRNSNLIKNPFKNW